MYSVKVNQIKQNHQNQEQIETQSNIKHKIQKMLNSIYGKNRLLWMC